MEKLTLPPSILPLLLLSGLLSLAQPATIAAPPVDGITFAADPDEIYIPIDEAARRLGWSLDGRRGFGKRQPESTGFDSGFLRKLSDGTALIGIAGLESTGASVTRSPGGLQVETHGGRRVFEVSVGKKRVEVNLKEQRLRAWEGNLLVLDCRISSGRGGNTPVGDFAAGPYKARRHFSSLYENAPMPWSVQVTGHIFIHGFSSVPDYPASHGCIRMPLDGENPAKLFYEWVDIGVPIKIFSK